MYAIILTGGKQYKVAVGDEVSVEKLDAAVGDEVSFDVLLLARDKVVSVEKPSGVDVLVAKQGEQVVIAMLEGEGKQRVEQNADVIVGTPTVAGVVAKGTVVEHGKGKKVIVFKYKPKKNIRKKNGHRQPYTKVAITAIG